MKILYAEDELDLSSAVTTILNIEGFDVDNAYDGLEAWNMLNAAYYDICVFDIMMPKMNGIELLEKMRNNNDFTPVIMLTAKTTTDDKIEGLSSGADDYLCKPFETKELIARIKSLTRRNSSTYKQKLLKFGNLTVNCENNTITGDNGSMSVSKKEIDLICELINNKGNFVNISDINNKIFNNETNNLSANLYIEYLIDKLNEIDCNCEIIKKDDSYKISLK